MGCVLSTEHKHPLNIPQDTFANWTLTQALTLPPGIPSLSSFVCAFMVCTFSVGLCQVGVKYAKYRISKSRKSWVTFFLQSIRNCRLKSCTHQTVFRGSLLRYFKWHQSFSSDKQADTFRSLTVPIQPRKRLVRPQTGTLSSRRQTRIVVLGVWICWSDGFI